ncbi:AraC family transcriptional regulator [Stutzerimonas stutzeri]|uniref:AraC family transcriptional regulator n=1 Tax=Stutzerimonas sp. S1 TaxID=3030652 RepID=UPI002224928C|nr:AraC family transcriptional regulator [Stutzerimonas sp. S1]MCW3147806.1 AraC family transcriptional regulator [Stutzerimonas sp. S1]
MANNQSSTPHRHATVGTHRDSISVRLVHEALLGFVRPGLSAEQLLTELGFDPACLQDLAGRVDVRDYKRLWLGLAERFDDELFGMDPRRLRSGSFVFISRCCIQQPTLEKAMQQALSFFGLALENFRGKLIRSQSLAEVVLRERNAEPARAFCYFTFWMLLHGLACWLVGRRIPLLAVELRCDEPDYTDDYRVMFSDNLRFGRSSTRLIFAAEVLDLPIRRSEAELRSFLAEAPANILVRYRDHSSLASRIKQHLRSLPAERWPDGETLAQALCMSASTLRRRLAEVGQPYQAIKDGLRQDMATEWLADAAISYGEIAERLGFADVSSFYKAFRKWTGINPGHYRNLILAPERR